MLTTVLDTVVVPVNRAARPFILGCLVVAVAGLLVSGWLFLLGLVATLACALFFRDPPRQTPVRPGLVVSPADGLVSAVGDALPPAELGLPAQALTRISIFLSVLDVHVNRVPIDGTIAARRYRPGRFLNAALDKASDDNERNALVITDADGRAVVVVQIAGLIARRIVCALAEGDRVRAGQHLGLIRFGSRVDVYLPADVAPLVAPGQRMIGGETVLADLDGREPPRLAELR